MEFIYVLCLFFLSNQLTENVLGQKTNGVSIQNISSQAVADYFDEKYEVSIKGFEGALVYYQMLKLIDITCGMSCNTPNMSKEIGVDFSGFEDLEAYGNLLAQANCVKICKEEHPFTKSKIERPRDDFIRDFEKRLPYNYLQFAYFKTGKIKKSCNAAYTFLQANPTDTQMQKNIDYYKGLDEVSDDYFVDLEGKPYVEFFKNGVEHYDEKNYADSVDKLEKALIDYFNALEECKSTCYVPKPPSIFPGFLQSISARYIVAIECYLKCDEKLRPAVGDSFVDNFVAKIYAYLQFSYYKLDKWGMAVSAAASALLLDPDDDVCVSNFNYYTKNAVAHGLDLIIHFEPRPEAVKYNLERKTGQEILNLMRDSVDYEDELEVTDAEEDNSKESLLREISKQVVMQIGQSLRGDSG